MVLSVDECLFERGRLPLHREFFCFITTSWVSLKICAPLELATEFLRPIKWVGSQAWVQLWGQLQE